MQTLKNKTILITGASTGIGAETAKHLANGNEIIVHYNRSLKEAEQVAEVIEKSGGKAHLIQANLASEEGCAELAKFIETQFGRLDVLINNAGGLAVQHSTQEITWDFMQQLFSLNTFSVMYLSSLLAPLLRKGENACVINITSTIIRSGGTVGPVYAAAKGAIDVFTRSLARELAPHIRVNGVAPGVIDTPFHHGVTSDQKMQEAIAMTPLKKSGEPIDVAKVIAMLIENTFMTGETIDVNGGLYMR
jgi:3-oxoacyl-[acyl-carrier protein] reductase